MKAPRFDYEKPKTLDAALALLAQGGDGAKVLAGGQSLGPLLNLRLAQPELLVDVRSLAELTGAHEKDDAVVLGACITHAAIEDGRTPDPTVGLLRSVARGIAYRAVRNRGTLGGSLAHADPAADWVTVMALLDAAILVRGPNGERRLPAATFMTGPLTTRLSPAEIIVGIELRRCSPRARTGYFKFNRKPGEFAEAIAAVLDDPAHGVRRAVIAPTQSAPFVIADASPFVDRFDEVAARGAVSSAGFAAGTYEHQVRLVALKRAAAQLR
jgi:carbon-monoxide dehydrogenase medium subunit